MVRIARASLQHHAAAVVGHDGRPGGALELEGAHAGEHLDGLLEGGVAGLDEGWPGGRELGVA
jgi:hypothetical protein